MVIVRHLHLLAPLVDDDVDVWQESPEFETDLTFAQNEIDAFAEEVGKGTVVTALSQLNLNLAELELERYVDAYSMKANTPERRFEVICICGYNHAS